MKEKEGERMRKRERESGRGRERHRQKARETKRQKQIETYNFETPKSVDANTYVCVYTPKYNTCELRAPRRLKSKLSSPTKPTAAFRIQIEWYLS